MREVSKQSDLKGIKLGEQWVYTGWPDPPTDDDFDKWQKADEKARADFENLVDYANKEAAKNIKVGRNGARS